MKIAIGCDHRGIALKQALMRFLKDSGHELIDFGTNELASIDYPDIARVLGKAVAEGQAEFGVLICSSGIGMSIAANKVRGILAALCHDTFSARRARLHNDANVLCLGQDILGEGLAFDILATFIENRFEGGRHAKRLDKVREIEAKFLDKV